MSESLTAICVCVFASRPLAVRTCVVATTTQPLERERAAFDQKQTADCDPSLAGALTAGWLFWLLLTSSGGSGSNIGPARVD